MVNPFVGAATDQYQNVLLNTGHDETYDRTHDHHGNLVAATRSQTPVSTHDYTLDINEPHNHGATYATDQYGSNYTPKDISPGLDSNEGQQGEKHVPEALKVVDVELDERAQAATLLRTSTWLNTFFLLTTDILGPSNAPYSIASMGYVPGWYVDRQRSVLSEHTAHPLTHMSCSC